MVILTKYGYGDDPNVYTFDVSVPDGGKMSFSYEYDGTSIEEIKELLTLLHIDYFEVIRN